MDRHARGRGWSGQLSRAAERYDEDSVRVRPGRGSRPRTRQRPRHENAADGFVLAVDRGRYTCLVADRRVLAMKARELGRGSIVVGDRVSLVGDTSGARDTLARIVRVHPRTSALRRSADDADPVERVIVAGADQLVVACALAQPPPRPRLIDRCLVAAYDAGLDPLLCLTKADLGSPDELVRTYGALGFRYVTTRRGEPLDEFRDRLAGRISVFVGHSGVGKSTLVNALVPDADRMTGAVNPTTGRGRHVSSSAVALEVCGGGWIIDTPGIRSFGLAHVAAGDVVAAFPEFAGAAEHCPPDCDHLGRYDAGDPSSAGRPTTGCALDALVASGRAEPARLESLRRLLRNRTSE